MLANEHAWERLTAVLGLPACAESTDVGLPLSEQEYGSVFSQLADALVKLPVLDVVSLILLFLCKIDDFRPLNGSCLLDRQGVWP